MPSPGRPGFGSPLLLEAAAVYAVNHRHYYAICDGDPSWKPPSLGFAWNVAGDYFVQIHCLQKELDAQRPGARPGAAALCDPRATSRLWASNRSSSRRAK